MRTIVQMPVVPSYLVFLLAMALCPHIAAGYPSCTTWARKDQTCDLDKGKCCNDNIPNLKCFNAFIVWRNPAEPTSGQLITEYRGVPDKCKVPDGKGQFGGGSSATTLSRNAFSSQVDVPEMLEDDEIESPRRSLSQETTSSAPLTHELRCGVTEIDAKTTGNECLDASGCTDGKLCWDVDADIPSTCTTRFSDPEEFPDCPPGQFCFGRGAMTICAPVPGPPVSVEGGYHLLGCSTTDYASGNVQPFPNGTFAKNYELAVAEAIRRKAPFYEVARSNAGGAGKTFETELPSTLTLQEAGSPGCDVKCDDTITSPCGSNGNSTSPRVWAVYGNGCDILTAPPVTPSDQAIFQNPEIKLFQCPLCAYITRVIVQGTCKVDGILNMTCSDGSILQTNMPSTAVGTVVHSTSFFASGFVAAAVKLLPQSGPEADNFAAVGSISLVTPDSTIPQVLNDPNGNCSIRSPPMTPKACPGAQRIIGIKARRPFDGSGFDMLEFVCGSVNPYFRIRSRLYNKCLDFSEFDKVDPVDLVTGGPARMTECIPRSLAAPPNSTRYFQAGSKGTIAGRQVFGYGDFGAGLQCLDINFGRMFFWPQSKGYEGYYVYHTDCNNAISQRWEWKYVREPVTGNLKYFNIVNRANGFCLLPRSTPEKLTLAAAPCAYAESSLASQFRYETM